MTISLVTSYQFNLADRDRINIGVLAYMRERNRGHVYNIVIGEFERSGISKAVLASRLGKAPEVISRWLGAPGNWTMDTVSDLLFAMSGAEPQYAINYPLAQQNINLTEPTPIHGQQDFLEAVPYYSNNDMIFMVSFDISPSPPQVLATNAS
jgi:hypothetical protein